jgi:hypothetical protein
VSRHGARVSRLVVLLIAVLAVLAAACAPTATVDQSQPGCSSLGSAASGEAHGAYGTEERGVMILGAQAVPSATLLPCIVTYPTGWTFAGWFARSGSFGFFLDSDRAGARAVEVELTARCDPGSAIEVGPSEDEAGTRRFEQPLSLPPNYATDRFYTFEGGCVVYRYRFGDTDDATLALEADQALGFRPRSEIVEDLDAIGLHLCGAGSPPCAGEE